MNQLATRTTGMIAAALTTVLILAFATVMTVSAQSDDPDWKLAPTGLNVTAGDEAGELDIIWDANSQDSKTLSDYRVTWTTDGEDFKHVSKTDWSAYPTSNQLTVTGLDAGATYQVKVRARYDDNKKSRWSDAVSGQTTAPTNTAATGQPTITGNPRVRETLTTIVSEIADANGLTNAVFTYQWIHSANDSEAYISGATSSSYLLSSEDLGHSIKIRVSFTDDDGYTESLTSSATALVVMPPNVAATGQPTVTGTVELGEELTAETSTIADDNGLTNTVFSHQWVRSTNGADNNITDATGSTYVITSADVASAIKVQVSFTDDDGYSETLSSSATVSVPEPAQAPPKEEPRIARSSHNVLVSNTGQTSQDNNTETQNRAQSFTTGTNTAGYALDSVVVGYNDTAGDTFSAAVWTTNSSGLPNALKHSLTAPTTFSQGDLTFTAPANATLDASTTYTVVMDLTNTNGVTFTRTSTQNSDEDSGAADGWSIGDTYHYLAFGTWTPSSTNKPHLIAIHGSLSASDDATLSDLELEDNTSTAITLSPSFVSGTTTYSAGVVNSVDEITITPTVNESNASYEIQDNAGTALTDADTNTTGFQVDLSEGANIINVEVTAEDASTETYTVTVTRTPADCETDDIWCATLTVGTHTAGGLTFYGYSVGLGDTTGTLSPNTFTYRAATIGVLALKYDSGSTGTLRWGISLLSGTTPTDGVLGDDDFTLHVGTHTFAIDAPGTTTTFTFPDHGLSWTVGDTVTVRLVKIPPSSDATLSNLIVNDGTYDLTLDPTFASTTYAYAADLDNLITTVTLTATVNDDTAEVSAVTLAGTAIADSDLTDGITVPSLLVGDNVIVVTVTAEDASTQTYTVTVARGIPYTEVPANWSFIPAGMNTIGDEFRLIFVSKARRGAGTTNIDSYNGWIQNQVAAGHHNVKAYSSTFKVLGCTEDVDARDNTRTTATGVPTYWLGGNKVADDYPDLYDRNWDDEANPRNERAEIDHNTTADNDMIWTGCKHNGTEVFYGGTSRALGTSSVQAGKLNRTSQSQGPLESSELITNNANRPMYGLSDVFRVVAANSNNPPVFTGGSTQTRSFAEVEGNTAVASESNIGDPFSATDSDMNALAYTLGGTDAGSFSFDASTGQIKQKSGEVYDYEAKSAYSVMVTVHDGTVSVTANVTINLTDVSEVPVQMDMPNVTPGSLSTSTLEVTWDIPPNDGRPPITHYSVQYQKSGDTSTLASIADIAAGFDTAVITGLQLGTAYQVQILAANDDGDGTWSPFGEGTTLSSLGTTMIVQDASAREDSSFLHFEINFSETLTENIFFDYTTSIESGDTAEENDFDAETVTDYRVQSGGDIAFITIDPNDDDLYEGDETFTITFSNLVNVYGTGNNLTATGTIIDDETQPDLSIFDASATEGEAIEFTVLLIGDLTEEDVTFDYATSRESDDNSELNDFTPTSGTGTITAGSSSTTITVPTFDDGHNDTSSRYEGDETFTVTISNPTLAGISQATAKGTIIDDESLPTVKFTSIDRIVTENAGHITDFLTFDVVPPGEHTAYISFTFSGTATEGQDYNIQNTTLTVNANVNSITTNIIMVNDNVAELDETAIITVVAASANIQVDPEFSTRTLTIQDDDEHPTLSFTSETYNVNENAGHAVLTVNKTGDSSFPVHVDYETVSRNLAIAGDDYVATSGTLTFQPEEFSKTISVPIIDNNIYRAFGQRFNVELIYSSQSNDQNVPSVGIDTAVVTIINDDPVPTASMANVTANERAGTMTLTLKLSHPSTQDISYRTPDNSEYRGGTATFEDDYEIQYDEIQQDVTDNATITVPAGQLTKSFDITLIDDDLEEPDETVELVWVKVSSSQATPDEFTFTGTITDPPICDALGNLENAIVVMNLTGEITQPGQSKFHRIRLDPYRSYMIEAIGRVGEDMLGVEEHPNLTLSNPDIPAIWNARATSKWITYGDRNDGDQPKNVIRRFLDSSYRTYKVEVNAGNNGTGTYQLKVRVNNICRLDENENAHYQWAGGPLGYPKGSDLPAGIGGRQVLLTGTDWGNNNVTRPEMHHVLGDNWDSNRDEDWIGVDLEDGELYTVRLRTKNNLPERLQATGLKILGIYDSDGNPISGTASAGAAGKKVFLTDWTAPSTGRFHIAVGSEGNDRTGTYWLSIIKDATN